MDKGGTPSIQAHGILIILRPGPDLIIENCSENTFNLIGWSASELIGKPLSTILELPYLKQIREASTLKNPEDLNPITFRCVNKPAKPNSVSAPGSSPTGKIWHASLKSTPVGVIIELEEAAFPRSITVDERISRVSSFGSLQSASTIAVFCQILCQVLSDLTEYDRVCVYKFSEDWSGQVLAEVLRNKAMDSFDGLMFPSTDIPDTTRTSFLTNRVRIVADINTDIVEVIPATSPLSRGPLDLSFSIFRSVRACHAQYMKNMQIRASMVVSLLIENKLWGLVVCHHLQPKFPGVEERAAFMDVINFASVLLTHRLAVEKKEQDITGRRFVSQLMDLLRQHSNPVEALLHHTPSLKDLIPCGGITVATTKGVFSSGSVPEDENIAVLLKYAKARPQDRTWSAASLGRIIEGGAAYKDIASGILSLPIGLNGVDYILWYRPEEEQEVLWAGSPKEAVKTNPETKEMGPRKSFARFKDCIKNCSAPWERGDKEAALSFRDLMIVESFRVPGAIIPLALAPEPIKEREQPLALDGPGGQLVIFLAPGPRHFFDLTSIPLALIDVTGCVMDVNAKLCKIAGSLLKDEMVGASFVSKLLSETCAPSTGAALARAVRGEEGVVTDVFFGLSSRPDDGVSKPVPYSTHLAPVKDPADRTLFIIAVFVDATEQSRSVESRSITQAAEAKRSFLQRINNMCDEEPLRTSRSGIICSTDSWSKLTARNHSTAQRHASPRCSGSPQRPSRDTRRGQMADVEADNLESLYVGSAFFSGTCDLILFDDTVAAATSPSQSDGDGGSVDGGSRHGEGQGQGPSPAGGSVEGVGSDRHIGASMGSSTTSSMRRAREEGVLDVGGDGVVDTRQTGQGDQLSLAAEAAGEAYVAALEGSVGEPERPASPGEASVEVSRNESPQDVFDLQELLRSTVQISEQKASAKSVLMSLVMKDMPSSRIVGNRMALASNVLALMNECVKFVSAGEIHLLVQGNLVTPHRLTVRLDLQDNGIGLFKSDVRSLHSTFDRLMDRFHS